MATIHTIGPFRLDADAEVLFRGNEPVALGRRAVAVLRVLVERAGALVSKDALIEAARSGQAVEESNLTVQVAALRRVLGEEPGGDRWIETLTRRGYRFVGPVGAKDEGAASEPAIEGAPTLALPDKPSIAVLPFNNLSGDREQEYFADGIAEDIITALARARWFFVTARNSSFAFKDKAVGVKQIARDLGVQYVLEGSVRKSDDRVRIAAQLIDAPAGIHAWGERYDRELRDIFAVQDEITERVAGAIEPELLKSEGLRATARATSSLTAWDLVRQGTWQFHQITKPTHFRGRELFREAVRLDPLLPEAHMWLGRISESIVGYGWSDDPASDLKEAVQSCLRGIQLDEKDPYGHYALSMSYLFSGALEQAIQAVEKSVDLSPSFALAHLGLGMARLYAGDAAGSIEPLERGLRLNPFDPQNFHWFRSLALACYFTDDPAKGFAAAVKASQVRPNWRPALEAMILCHVALGQSQAAHRCAEQATRLAPPESDVLEQLKIRNPRWAERIAVMLRAAGVPE
jgi:TolB-like protein